ncbi:uncharacterized protein LOC135493812 [Lineus longissimus]|uniref:uncharacterized protein LOC135493812 n=1 Tax=Lineus longissimus TaxID=88925 RepID=UPI002B4CFB75
MKYGNRFLFCFKNMFRADMIVIVIFAVIGITAATDIVSPKPVAYWPLNYDDHTKDVSGNKNDAIAHGVTLTSGLNGKVDGAYQFEGKPGSYLKVTMTPLLDVGKTGSFSYAAYIYPQGSSGCLFEWSINPYGTNIWLIASADNVPEILVTIKNSISNDADSRGYDKKLPLKLNEWNFVGVVYDFKEGVLSVMVDDATITVNRGKVKALTNVPFIYIGVRPPPQLLSSTSPFSGKMTCIMLWNQALTGEEMTRVREFCSDRGRIAAIDDSFLQYHPFQLQTTGTHMTLVPNAVIDTQSDVTLVTCASACTTRLDCVTFGYSEANKECKLSNQAPYNDVALPGYVIYMIKKCGS